MAPFKRTSIAAALIAAGLTAQAQSTALKPVVITDKAFPSADVTGFGDIPLVEVPASVGIISRKQIEEVGAKRLADLTRFDSSVGDAYNAPGYWDFLSIRGFTLDNRFNYRREGLPINAETAIPLFNKESVEILKGTSGMQAGTSAPGGIVNYVVKRPTETNLREVILEASEGGSVLASADIGGRAGPAREFGYRINVAHEQLRPLIRHMDGNRSLLAFAGDWRAGRDSVVEAEVEWSTQKQQSQSGWSLLGAAVPPPQDPRANLNNQPWVQPTQFDGLTGTLRFTQSIGRDWKWVAQLGTQRLKTDDFTAFPFGCGAEGNFDRFCSDGTFDYYDFRSEGERRRQDAAQLNLKGRLATGVVTHDLSFGVLASRTRVPAMLQAFNWVGTGHIDGTAVVPPDPSLTFPLPARDEKSVELFAQGASKWTDRFTTWAGLRHTRIDRGYDQSLTTPWLAASYKLGGGMAYASWGQGVESYQVTSDPVLSIPNAGAVLPARKSEQWEAGLKGGSDKLGWSVAVFSIKRPMTNFQFCARTFSCAVGEYDGSAVHRGVEASASWAEGPWRLDASATLLDAKREGSVYEPAINGERPTNVPSRILRTTAAYRVGAVPGLEIEGHMSHEGGRNVLSDGSASIPSWTRFDLGARYAMKMSGLDTTWTVAVHNVANRRYWKEAPTQFNHVYLYPGAPRTVRIAFTAGF